MVDMRGIALYYEIQLKKKGLTENVSFIVVLQIFAYQKIYIFSRLAH